MKIVKMDGDDAYEPTIHDLFNELHRRLTEESLTHLMKKGPDIASVASSVDSLHRDYTYLKGHHQSLVDLMDCPRRKCMVCDRTINSNCPYIGQGCPHN